MAENKVKESYLLSAIANDYAVAQNSVKFLDWTESAGAGLTDGFTTEIIAVKGTAKIKDEIKKFSYIVKLAPESGYMAQMVKEVNVYIRKFRNSKIVKILNPEPKFIRENLRYFYILGWNCGKRILIL